MGYELQKRKRGLCVEEWLQREIMVLFPGTEEEDRLHGGRNNRMDGEPNAQCQQNCTRASTSWNTIKGWLLIFCLGDGFLH